MKYKKRVKIRSSHWRGDKYLMVRLRLPQNTKFKEGESVEITIESVKLPKGEA